MSEPVGKVQLYRIRLNAQGYAYGKYGQYYGVGKPLYLAHDQDDFIEEFRAYDREDAKEILREKYPNIQFCK